jgi:acetyl esterase/lipase
MGTTGDDTSFNLHPVSKKVSSEVQAVCNWFGPSDFLRMNDAPGAIDHDSPDSPESRFIGGPIQQNPELVKRANPITYITEKDPPFLHLHGSSDRLVLLSQSELLHAALTDLNVQSELHVVVDGGHGFRGSREPMPAIVGRSMNFFDAILKPQNEAK